MSFFKTTSLSNEYESDFDFWECFFWILFKIEALWALCPSWLILGISQGYWWRLVGLVVQKG